MLQALMPLLVERLEHAGQFESLQRYWDLLQLHRRGCNLLESDANFPGPANLPDL